MDRELTYQVPSSSGCAKLGRPAPGAKRILRLVGGALAGDLGVFAPGSLLLVGKFGDEVERWQASVGLPSLTVLLVIIAAGIVATLALRRAGVRESRPRCELPIRHSSAPG